MQYQIANVVEKEGYLELSILPEELAEFQDLVASVMTRSGLNQDIEILTELLEPYWTNGSYELVSPAAIGALTEAPIIASEVTYEDDGKVTFPDDVKIWWYPQYETTSVTDELLEKNVVRFTKAPTEKDSQ